MSKIIKLKTVGKKRPTSKCECGYCNSETKNKMSCGCYTCEDCELVNFENQIDSCVFCGSDIGEYLDMKYGEEGSEEEDEEEDESEEEEEEEEEEESEEDEEEEEQ